MTDVVAKLDDWGLPAWIATMVVGFVVFWPIGLGILAYLIWSGRMGCGRGGWSRWKERTEARWERKVRRMSATFPASGNRAFDEYREETLSRLYDEQKEFSQFLERLRMAKDKAEFDQFMAERRTHPNAPPPTATSDPAPSA